MHGLQFPSDVVVDSLLSTPRASVSLSSCPVRNSPFELQATVAALHGTVGAKKCPACECIQPAVKKMSKFTFMLTPLTDKQAAKNMSKGVNLQCVPNLEPSGAAKHTHAICDAHCFVKPHLRLPKMGLCRERICFRHSVVNPSHSSLGSTAFPVLWRCHSCLLHRPLGCSKFPHRWTLTEPSLCSGT